jgi:hypothetical protein
MLFPLYSLRFRHGPAWGVAKTLDQAAARTPIEQGWRQHFNQKPD